jgi:hypothetical protein
MVRIMEYLTPLLRVIILQCNYQQRRGRLSARAGPGRAPPGPRRLARGRTAGRSVPARGPLCRSASGHSDGVAPANCVPPDPGPLGNGPRSEPEGPGGGGRGGGGDSDPRLTEARACAG